MTINHQYDTICNIKNGNIGEDMRVKIGKYVNFFGPFQLAESLCFWARDVNDEYGLKRKPDWVHNFGEFLAYGKISSEPAADETRPLLNNDDEETWLYRLLMWIHNHRQRKIKIHIDRWDTWSMDDTLATIILPMLRQLKESKHGAPFVDSKDVPENLRATRSEAAAFRRNGTTDDKFFERWDWVISEMIFAFEHIVDDSWEDQYCQGEIDWLSKPVEWDDKGKPTMYQMVDGPNHTYECDYDAIRDVHKRIDRGLLFFGKYYRGLWD